MKTVIFAHILLFLLTTVNAQYYPSLSVDSVVNRINYFKFIEENDLTESLGVDIIDSLIQDLKDYTDHLYYVTKWNLSKIETDENKRIRLLKQISHYQYYLVKNREIIRKAGPLYELSIHQLIKEYKGNADLLKSIKIVPGYQMKLYPKLKREIEAAGGVWERGPIQQTFDPNIKVGKN